MKSEKEYSFGREVLKIAALTVLEYAGAWALLLGIGLAASKYYERKDRKAQK